MPHCLSFLCLFALILAWEIYLDRRGFTFILGLTWTALGIAGLIAGSIFGARHGPAGILMGAICGAFVGYTSSLAFAGIASCLGRLYCLVTRRRRHQER